MGRMKNQSVVLILFATLLIVIIVSAVIKNNSEKTFETDDFKIRMSSSFKGKNTDGAHYLFENKDVGAVFSVNSLSSLGFDEFATTEDVLKYAQTINAEESFYNAQRQTVSTYSFIEREFEDNSKNQYQMFGVVCGNNKVLLFTFSCLAKDRDKYENDFKTWAGTISIK